MTHDDRDDERRDKATQRRGGIGYQGSYYGSDGDDAAPLLYPARTLPTDSRSAPVAAPSGVSERRR